MTPTEELDLARARDLYIADQSATQAEAEKWWDKMPARFRDKYIAMARLLRLSDEARGLRVVPVELVDAVDFWFRQDQHRGAGPIRAKTGHQAALDNLRIVWLAASPFAPGDGE